MPGSDYMLRLRAQTLITEGKLPSTPPTRMVSGLGANRPCSLCEESAVWARGRSSIVGQIRTAISTTPLSLAPHGRGTDNGTRVPPERRATDAPKRYLRGGVCSLVPHASVGVTRAHAQPIAACPQVPLVTFIRRAQAFHCTLGKRENVRSSSPPSPEARHDARAAPGQRLAHVRSNAAYALRAASALVA
jgi:hypothetical protein